MVFRLGATITIPGVTITNTFENDSIFGIMNMLGGGALNQFSLFALGVSPYITASIIIQLLSSDVIPSLSQKAKSGEAGRKELQKTTKYLALVLSLVQGFALTYVMKSQGVISFESGTSIYIFIMVILAAGACFTVWLGDQISDKGIGNGLSIIIFAGIVANLPYQIFNTYNVFVDSGSAQTLFAGIMNFAFYMIGWLILLAFMTFINESVRKVPIQYAHKYDLNKKEEVPYLPIKVNTAGVIPVIFASALITAPATIAAFFPDREWAWFVEKWFNLNNIYGIIGFILLIFGFTFFQAHTQVDGDKIGEDLQKSGAYIPGVRPGEETKKYIRRIVNRITLIGALFLMFVAALPYILQRVLTVNPPLQIGGTALIIVVGVSIETIRQVQGRMAQKNYKSFVVSSEKAKVKKEEKEEFEW